MMNYFEGEPKLYLTPNGANLLYQAGQPVMERGKENQVYISLLTKKGWCGNIFLLPENNIGSDYEETCAGSITLSKLADIENSAIRALTSKTFQKVNAEAKNPNADNLDVKIYIHDDSFNLSREGIIWKK